MRLWTMAFGLQHEDEMEDWLQPGRFAFPRHGGGHFLMRSTRLCVSLYLELLDQGFCEKKLSRMVAERADEHGIGEENAFDQVVLSLSRKHGIRLSKRTLHLSRQGYAERRSS